MKRLPKPHRATVPWSSRLLAGLGFFLALVAGGLLVSQQIAAERARTYLRRRYRTNLELTVHRVRADFLTGPTASRRPPPPFGFCWRVDVSAGPLSAVVMIHPWTQEIVDWELEL